MLFLETVDPKKDRLPIRIHTFLRRNLFFYRPWTIYWMLYFGPWTWLFRALSWVIPKKKGLIVFGSNEGKHFSDNSRALFEYMQNNALGKKTVWFTRNRTIRDDINSKYPGTAVVCPSLKASYLYLRAEEAVISFGYQDLCKMPWIPSIKVNQLWHGVPLKRIGLLRNQNKTEDDYGQTARLFLRWCGKVDRFFVASKYEREMHSLAFNIPEDQFKITGNPRNDRLYGFKQRENHDMKTILYAPTFRERGDGPGKHSRTLMHPKIDEQMMAAFLRKINAKLILRPHWITHGHEFESPRIETITHSDEPDLFNIFETADILVTDYSSAFIDWLILDRPVVFAPYDLDEYSESSGLLDDYHGLVPPPVCQSPEDIFQALQEAVRSPALHRLKRMELMEKYLGNLGPGASERISKIMGA